MRRVAVLQIEHSIHTDFDTWKRSSGYLRGKPLSDELLDRLGGREASGVCHYFVGRLLDDPNRIIINFETDTRENAERLLDAFREEWRQIPGLLAEVVTGTYNSGSEPLVMISEVVVDADY
jgi:hypothetical protein